MMLHPAAPVRADWPTGPRRAPSANAEIARKFETLIAETLLRSARAASLGDDGLGASGDHIRATIDHHRAEAIARAAPLGVARLLAPLPAPACGRGETRSSAPGEGVPALRRMIPGSLVP